MICDHAQLILAANCFRCIPRGSQKEVQIYLLSQWVGCLVPTPPTPPVGPPFSYTPTNQLIFWDDKNGAGQSAASLTLFNAHADIPSVTSIALDTGFVTSISNLSSLPALQTAILDTGTYATLDCTGCSKLSHLDCSSGVVANLILSGCVALNWLDASADFLPLTVVNYICIILDGFGLHNGTLHLQSQTPPAPPTGSGVTAKNSLIAKGWAVTTD